jgi:hypothetical protein
MTANKLRTFFPAFCQCVPINSILNHFQVLDTIVRRIHVKIICRIERILKTYSKVILLFTEHTNIFNSAYDKEWRLMWPYNENCKLNIRHPPEVAFELHPHIIPGLIFFLHTPPCLVYCTWYELN